jgi:ABC-type lipoprotein release transport system permease subunit
MVWKNNSFYVGFFLAIREIRRSNPWTTALITLIIGLTFFNMLFIGGLLFGLADGFFSSYKTYYSGDIFVSPAVSKNDIEQTENVISVIKSLPSYKGMSVRYVTSGILAYNYQNKLLPTDLSESATGQLVGIDPVAEDKVTHLSRALVAGAYLSPTDVDEILVGSTLMQKYATVRNAANTAGTRILTTADVGSRVLLTVNNIQKEVIIKGVITTGVPAVDGRIYMVDSVVRQLMGNTNLNANEIAVSLTPNASDTNAENYIIKNLANDQDIVVQTSGEILPAGVASEIQVFTKLDDLIGGIALIISSITIFIVNYVNAITRRKYLGILKGIGISSNAIEISYVFQAFFYAISGIVIATILIMGLLVPYFELHPFSISGISGTIAITMGDVYLRAIELTIASVVSGFIPAWIVARQNTLDAILGR